MGVRLYSITRETVRVGFVLWRARLNETQKRIDAADEDLDAIVQTELGYIQKRGEFAKLDELVSSRDLSPEMLGRHGYIYSIHLEETGIIASAYPAPGEQLPALLKNFFGPRIAPVLARLQKEH